MFTTHALRIHLLGFRDVSRRRLPRISREAPKGEVKQFSFNKAEIFPGTVRDYWIYVPKQYDPAKPACLYVNQDGVQYKAPEVFDQLIHKQEMPVTMGVCVDARPGEGNLQHWLDRSIAATSTTAWETTTCDSCSTSCCPTPKPRRLPTGRPIRFSKNGFDRDRRSEQRRR